jgi:hypothetical protein
MRRLTIWITVTLAISALLVAYQLGSTSVKGRHGEQGPPLTSSQTRH